MNRNYVMPTYGRKSVTFTEGKGMWLKDEMGQNYMDMVSGVAVNCLGHSSQIMIKAIENQANQLIHISNLYWNGPQVALAEKLIALSEGNMKDVFFCNSGTEALEGAIKLCKKYGLIKNKKFLIYMDNSFHGRTNGALSITGQIKYQEPFGDLIPNCISVPFNDIDALLKVFDNYGLEIAAVFIEPIQGEGGVIEADREYLKILSDMCQKNDALLVFDEVQCGAGRMGTYYGYQSVEIVPDIICMAKGLGGGVPIGAILANEKASVFNKGDHGSTYGGNPLVCGVALAVTETVSDALFLNQVTELSKKLSDGLNKLKESGKIIDYRGKGLLLGVVVENPAKLVDMAFDEKLLLISAGSETVRLLPPLNITLEDVNSILEKLEYVLNKYQMGGSNV